MVFSIISELCIFSHKHGLVTLVTTSTRFIWFKHHLDITLACVGSNLDDG